MDFSVARDTLRVMPEKSLGEIPRNWREQYEKGLVALQRQNLDYAISLFSAVLQHEPGFYECREALRAAQYKKAGTTTGFFRKAFGAASNSPLVLKGQLALRNDPREALHIAEQVLQGDPHNSMAHKLLADAALAADFPKTAVLSLEILLKNSPQDRDVALKLARALIKAGQTNRAETVFSQMAQAYPDDQEIAQAWKDFVAHKTMREGGYDALADGTGSYRDVIRDKDEAVRLEQQQRVVKSEDVAQRLIDDLEAQRAKEPGSLKLVRSLAGLYCDRKDFDRALACYQQIAGSEMGNDPSLQQAIADTNLKKLDHAIAQLDAQAPDYAETLARLTAERQNFQIAECQRRVEKYPTDLQFRFELGQLLFQANRINDAIQEFQKAKANPHKHLQAMFFLGQCFYQKKMFDLAAKTFESALKEKLVFDDEKKELHYALGGSLEKLGKKEEAIEQYKLIYEVDIGFRDVAQKVDAFYAGS